MRSPRIFLASLLCSALAAALLGCSKPEPSVDNGTSPIKAKVEAGDAPKAKPPAAKPADAGGKGALPTTPPALLDPAAAKEQAPATFKAKFTTTKGDFVVQVTREWSPAGADRFYNLVKIGYYNDTRFFRAIDDFMVQFGLHGDPAVNRAWTDAQIKDDPVMQSNKRGYVTFAKTGAPNSRTTQIFINYVDGNAKLDAMGFAPFGQVVEGMSVVDSLYKGYGEGAPGGSGPFQGKVKNEGNAYLDKEFPKLDGVKRAEIMP
jgi:peptidyl-prolyl cis-trans isomerase A (cyclophilin A)